MAQVLMLRAIAAYGPRRRGHCPHVNGLYCTRSVFRCATNRQATDVLGGVNLLQQNLEVKKCHGNHRKE
jgi:hypothetical protein